MEDRPCAGAILFLGNKTALAMRRGARCGDQLAMAREDTHYRSE